MKNLVITSLVICTFVSCSKTNSPTPPPPVQDSLLKSFSLYLPQTHAKLIEIFAYDKAAQLASVHGYSYDSSSGSAVIDSAVLNFTQADTTTPPTAYDVTFYNAGDPPSGTAEHHLLFYDNLKQVTIDSITSSQNSLTVQHFIYDLTGNTTIQWLFGDPQIPGSYAINQVDTLFIQQNNILTDINYSGSSFNHLYMRQYSANANPLYNTDLSNSLGSLLVFNGYRDFRSKNLPSQFISEDTGAPTYTLNYTWTMNASGKVVQGEGMDSNSGLPIEVYNYSY